MATLDPDKRQAIAQAIRDGGTRNAIAREHGVSAGTVTNIAKTEGIDGAFDRSSAKRASAARSTDLAARRTELAVLLMDRAFKLERRLDEQQAQVVVLQSGRDSHTEIVYIDPTAADVRNFMTAIGIAVDKVAALTRDDAQGLSAVDSWLADVIEGGS